MTAKSDQNPDPYWLGTLDPDPDPHWGKKLDPDLHWSRCWFSTLITRIPLICLCFLWSSSLYRMSSFIKSLIFTRVALCTCSKKKDTILLFSGQLITNVQYIAIKALLYFLWNGCPFSPFVYCVSVKVYSNFYNWEDQRCHRISTCVKEKKLFSLNSRIVPVPYRTVLLDGLTYHKSKIVIFVTTWKSWINCATKNKFPPKIRHFFLANLWSDFFLHFWSISSSLQ